MDLNAYPVLTVLIIAAASSMLAELPLRVRVPMVVWEMIFGMIVGPHLLGLARPIGQFNMFGERVRTYTLLGERGLAALFFMAGLDLDLKRVRGRPLQLALAGWTISLGLAFGGSGSAACTTSCSRADDDRARAYNNRIGNSHARPALRGHA